MPWWSTLHPWRAGWHVKQHQHCSAVRGGGAGRRRVLKPTVPSVMSTVTHLNCGETSVIKWCHQSLPVISKMFRFCASLSYSLGHLPICVGCDSPHLEAVNEPLRYVLNWLQYDMHGGQNEAEKKCTRCLEVSIFDSAMIR